MSKARFARRRISYLLSVESNALFPRLLFTRGLVDVVLANVDVPLALELGCGSSLLAAEVNILHVSILLEDTGCRDVALDVEHE